MLGVGLEIDRSIDRGLHEVWGLTAGISAQEATAARNRVARLKVRRRRQPHACTQRIRMPDCPVLV